MHYKVYLQLMYSGFKLHKVEETNIVLYMNICRLQILNKSDVSQVQFHSSLKYKSIFH
jgi:hypothetical protein